VLTLGYELGNDVLRAQRLAHDLHVSERRLSLAASASGTVLWEWRAGQNAIWSSSAGRALYGIPASQPLTFADFSSILHPEDREEVLRVIEQAAESCGAFAIEYRIRSCCRMTPCADPVASLVDS
jgi:PAS domain-containing protein